MRTKCGGGSGKGGGPTLELLLAGTRSGLPDPAWAHNLCQFDIDRVMTTD